MKGRIPNTSRYRLNYAYLLFTSPFSLIISYQYPHTRDYASAMFLSRVVIHLTHASTLRSHTWSRVLFQDYYLFGSSRVLIMSPVCISSVILMFPPYRYDRPTHPTISLRVHPTISFRVTLNWFACLKYAQSKMWPLRPSHLTKTWVDRSPPSGLNLCRSQIAFRSVVCYLPLSWTESSPVQY